MKKCQMAIALQPNQWASRDNDLTIVICEKERAFPVDMRTLVLNA